MAEIIPAILPKSFDELSEKLDLIAGHVPSVQIDICDGAFVPNRSWPCLKGYGNDQVFSDIVAEFREMPHWDSLDFEFDLMIKDTYSNLPDFICAGASRIVIHKASVDDEELAACIKDYGKTSDAMTPFGIELGLGLMPADDVQVVIDSIKDIAANLHFVQVMGIGKIGFQGQPHDPRSVALVRALKTAYPALPVAVDGAVNMDTAPLFIDAGADRLVVGSALFGTGDFLGTLEEFRAL